MKVTTILSGGLDSTTLLYYALSKTKDVKVLSYNYGQRHKKELDFAVALCKELGLEHKVVDISVIQDLLIDSVLTDTARAVPEGHYEQANMKQTVVPNRNAIMLSIAYGYAISNKSNVLYYGAHAGDHFIYPDCRDEFVRALDSALYIANLGFSEIKIEAPFVHKTKSEVVTEGIKLGVPFEKTWSCYKGVERPCGKCGTCVERTESFMNNNMKDPAMTEVEWNEAVTYLQSLTAKAAV